jgi:hypothetical protein
MFVFKMVTDLPAATLGVSPEEAVDEDEDDDDPPNENPSRRLAPAIDTTWYPANMRATIKTHLITVPRSILSLCLMYTKSLSIHYIIKKL